MSFIATIFNFGVDFLKIKQVKPKKKKELSEGGLCLPMLEDKTKTTLQNLAEFF